MFRVHERLGIEFSYGGYLEDRSFLMRDHYQKVGWTWHLGIDYTVPAGTPVHIPMGATLASFTVDKDQDGGWGGKAVFKAQDHFLIFGHLNKITPKHSYEAGDLIGTIAPFESNGGWFPHLHVQAVRSYLNPHEVDGYARLYEGIDLDFPRPDLLIQSLLGK